MRSDWYTGVLALVVGAGIITAMLIVVSGCQVNERPQAAPLIWRK